MSNSNSESSDFWNLSKKDPVAINSESSDFWNLSKKKYKKYTSEDFSSEEESDEEEVREEESPDETVEDVEDVEEESIIIPNKPKQKLTKSNNQIDNDLTQVTVNIPTQNNTLPSKKIIPGDKKFSDYTIKEFYKKFMKSVIGIVKELKEGKGINSVLSDKDRLIHFGIVLIIISILLVPLTLN